MCYKQDIISSREFKPASPATAHRKKLFIYNMYIILYNNIHILKSIWKPRLCFFSEKKKIPGYTVKKKRQSKHYIKEMPSGMWERPHFLPISSVIP